MSVKEKINIKSYKQICYDSRKVEPGSIFVCIEGEKSDGHKFIDQVIEAGATLIIARQSRLSRDELQAFREKAQSKNIRDFQIIEVEDTRLELAQLSSLIYGEPSKIMRVLGITGTNGKTTVSHIIQSIFSTKYKCALLGTMGFKETLEEPYQDLGNTTPQSTEVQKLLSESLAKEIPYLTMEVSSHALDQHRVSAVDYRGVMITNLTQDHLDYHMTMDKYFAAKAKIFDLAQDYVILNADDEFYNKFKDKALEISTKRDEEGQRGFKVITFGLSQHADLRADDIRYSDAGLSYTLHAFNHEPIRINSQLNGLFNVYNSLVAIAAAIEENFSLEEIQEALANTPPVAGRFEVIKNDKSPMCIVDYAHSPDGLENILKGAAELKKESGKLICLFGCGGDRDMTKRPKMGKIAFDLADISYVTSDNPRSEDPEQIIADILTGIPNMDNTKVIADRAEAIKTVIQDANPEDIVVVAGKGHEDYQILGTETIYFDDREEVRKAIDSL